MRSAMAPTPTSDEHEALGKNPNDGPLAWTPNLELTSPGVSGLHTGSSFCPQPLDMLIRWFTSREAPRSSDVDLP